MALIIAHGTGNKTGRRRNAICMKQRSYTRTGADRHPYIRTGKYWEVFGHLFTVTASEEFRKRMLEIKAEDERLGQKKFMA